MQAWQASCASPDELLIHLFCKMCTYAGFNVRTCCSDAHLKVFLVDGSAFENPDTAGFVFAWVTETTCFYLVWATLDV